MKAARQWLLDAHDAVQNSATRLVSDAPRWLLACGLSLGVGLITALTYLYRRPENVLQLSRRTAVWSAGFTVKYIKGTRYTYSYMERGNPKQGAPSMLFLHGLCSRKEDWIALVKYLPRHVHVVAVDLLGHGQSSLPTDTNEASLSRLVDCLEEFVSLVDLGAGPFHLIGTSMGGAIAAIYTSRHCAEVDRLTLMCPAIKCPIESEMWHRQPEDYLPEDPVQLRTQMSHLVYDKSAIPQSLWVYRALVKERREKRTFFIQLARSMRDTFYLDKDRFESSLSRIAVPVQIIWGEEDECVHVSGASLLEGLIRSVRRTDVLPRCGHVLALEQTDVTRSLIMDFYNCTYSS